MHIVPFTWKIDWTMFCSCMHSLHAKHVKPYIYCFSSLLATALDRNKPVKRYIYILVLKCKGRPDTPLK